MIPNITKTIPNLAKTHKKMPSMPFIPDTFDQTSQSLRRQSAIIVEGNQINQNILTSLKQDIKSLTENNQARKPKLALVSVGTSAAATSYITKKMKVCKKIGIESSIYNFSEKTNPKSIEKFITKLSSESELDSISLELPLPDHMPKHDFIQAISREKDVDCLKNITNFNGMKLNFQDPMTNKFPCTPKAIMTILDHYNIQLQGKKAVIIGKGMLVGYPLSSMLIQRFCQVTTLDEYSQNIEQHIKEADILISAAGQRHLVRGEWIKEGAAVVDVGANSPIDGIDTKKIVGDVDYEEALEKAGLITPVPGGVGPVTAAIYLQNVVTAWKENISQL